MASTYFSDEYKTTREALKKGGFPKDSVLMVANLRGLMAEDGPGLSADAVLDTLRKKCAGATGTDGEADAVKALAGTGSDEVARVAALKLLRHLHLLQGRGEHSLWISTMPEAYRQKKIDPVTLGGVRYEQATDPDAGPDVLSTGYLRAVDAASGKELWMKRIYTPDLNPALEIDVQEVYFTTLELSKDGTRLIVGNEAGKSWSVDPKTGAETAIDD